MKSAHVVEEATAALESDDFQLIRTAAGVMKGMQDGRKESASDALLAALRRLTDGQRDPSRDPRVAILERLAEALPPVRNQELLPYVGDYDDKVAEAAEKAFEKLVGAPSARVEKRRRYPFQAQLSELKALPTEAIIELESGTVRIALLSDVAPVTVARFAKLVAEGYYNGLTFHRIVPNFVVQGGSPGANEYMGASRYMRDEVGPQGVHVRSAVGISTRGGDTGDGQIFIDLADAPRLDRDYTVFAYVTSGMEFVDRILEGAKIVSVSVK
jgi:cyclophilin family peptidyl-prolyl cis-trans isomerase